MAPTLEPDCYGCVRSARGKTARSAAIRSRRRGMTRPADIAGPRRRPVADRLVTSSRRLLSTLTTGRQYGRRHSRHRGHPRPSSRKMMIVVTPNLCIDRTHWLDHFEPGTVNRPRRAVVAAGGKGVNVARALRDLGRAPAVLGYRPAEGGDQVRAAAARRGAGVRRWSTRRASSARRSSWSRTAAGPPCSTSPARRWTPRTATRCWTGWPSGWPRTGARLVIGSGSLPPGLPADTYARLCRTAREHGAQVIVDAARDALAARAGRRAGPGHARTWPRPRAWPPAWSSRPPTHAEDRAEIRERAQLAARSLRAAGARRAVVTAGAHGAAYADDEGELWCDAPAVAAVNPIGAGDAFVGGRRRPAAGRGRLAGRGAPRGAGGQRRGRAPARRPGRPGPGRAAGGRVGRPGAGSA